MTNRFLKDLDILEGNVSDLISESDTAAEAKRRGWIYHGYGYWEDSSGKVVGRTIDNKLVPITQSMASTFQNVTVGGETKPSNTTNSATEAPPKPTKPKPRIPPSKNGQPTSFYSKLKASAEDTIEEYTRAIKDIVSLPDFSTVLKGFSSLLAHSSIPIESVPRFEFEQNPNVMGRWFPIEKKITIIPSMLDALEQKLPVLQMQGISGLMKDYIWGSTGGGDAPISNARMTADTRVAKEALAGIATIFHETIHANDSILNEAFVVEEKLKTLVMMGWASPEQVKQYMENRRPLLSPELMSFEFMTEHKARTQIRELSKMDDSVYMKNVLSSLGGYSPTLTSYYEIFALANVDVDALTEDMWDSKDLHERNDKLESAVVSAIKTSIDVKLKNDGIDVSKLGELDAEIYSDMHEAFDDISKIISLHVLPNVSAQEVVQSFYKEFVSSSPTKKSVFKTRAEKPYGFDALDDMCRVMSGYAVNSNAIIQHMVNVENNPVKREHLASLGRNPNDWRYDDTNAKERQQKLQDYLRYVRNKKGL